MSTTRTLRALLLLAIVTLGVIGLGDRISIPALSGLATRVKAEVGRPRYARQRRRRGTAHGAPQLICVRGRACGVPRGPDGRSRGFQVKRPALV